MGVLCVSCVPHVNATPRRSPFGKRREAVLAKEISTLGRAVERGESMAARIEAMQTELQARNEAAAA